MTSSTSRSLPYSEDVAKRMRREAEMGSGIVPKNSLLLEAAATIDWLCEQLKDTPSEKVPTIPSRMVRSNTGQEADKEWEGWVRGWNACVDQMEYNLNPHRHSAKEIK
jgi:hypothetical protein